MIGDGMGFNQVLAADYYLYGKADANPFANFPVRLAMSTYSLGDSPGPEDDAAQVYSPSLYGRFDEWCINVTESSAAATAMSTGKKCANPSIAVAPDGRLLRHTSQDFEEQGKSTGVVTSVPITHATPAGFVAHNAKRSAYAAIAQEMIKESATDVIMGCGHPLYSDDNELFAEPNYGYIPEDLWLDMSDGEIMGADANHDGTPDLWTFIETKEQFEALLSGPVPDRVLGVARAWQTLQCLRVEEDWAKPAYTTPFNTGVPTLETMVKGALRVLSKNPKGFFLMIEGSAQEWAGHYSQPGRLIEEQEDFYNTVQAVIDWIETNSSWDETLLIVTADHETGLLSGAEGILSPVVNNSKGVMPTMYFHVGTTYGIPWHSSQLVPFYAKGAGAELYFAVADQYDPYRGWYLDNTEISAVIRELCGIKNTKCQDILAAKELGLVPAGLQNYAAGITRENFCILAYELLHKAAGTEIITPHYQNDPDPFTDHTSYISYKIFTLYKLGIVNGVGENKFAPDKILTREEAATILNRIAAYLGSISWCIHPAV
ncbi:MAG: alkaline phosphatase [Firmicutes bacterium]|nr:alkaline phosphatase [Bacillota bacterium]